MQHHLSMMFVAEKYVELCLEDKSDYELDLIIEERLSIFKQMKTSRIEYVPLGFKVTNNIWQKLSHFAVKYQTSVAKIASCLFHYSVSAYEFRDLMKKEGITFKYKKVNGRDYHNLNERLSDY